MEFLKHIAFSLLTEGAYSQRLTDVSLSPRQPYKASPYPTQQLSKIAEEVENVEHGKLVSSPFRVLLFLNLVLKPSSQKQTVKGE